jgi:hypothetical protein
MLQFAYQYLLLQKKMCIPGVGIFTLQHQSAAFNYADNVLLPPEETIAYKAETALADKQFYEFLAHQLQTDEVSAIKQFHDFSYDLKQQIQQNHSVQLDGLGILKKNSLGITEFIPAPPLLVLNEPVSLLTGLQTEPAYQAPQQLSPAAMLGITEEDLQPYVEEPIPKDRWWVWAILMAVAGAFAIWFYYSQQA